MVVFCNFTESDYLDFWITYIPQEKGFFDASLQNFLTYPFSCKEIWEWLNNKHEKSSILILKFCVYSYIEIQ